MPVFVTKFRCAVWRNAWRFVLGGEVCLGPAHASLSWAYRLIWRRGLARVMLASRVGGMWRPNQHWKMWVSVSRRRPLAGYRFFLERAISGGFSGPSGSSNLRFHNVFSGCYNGVDEMNRAWRRVPDWTGGHVEKLEAGDDWSSTDTMCCRLLAYLRVIVKDLSQWTWSARRRRIKKDSKVGRYLWMKYADSKLLYQTPVLPQAFESCRSSLSFTREGQKMTKWRRIHDQVCASKCGKRWVYVYCGGMQQLWSS